MAKPRSLEATLPREATLPHDAPKPRSLPLRIDSGLTEVQEYGYIVYMKATIDIPDDLYRRVKAKSALQGQPVREVVMHLFLDWIEAPDENLNRVEVKGTGAAAPAWFGAAKTYARKVAKHDMDSVRESIARGRGGPAVSSSSGKPPQ